MELTADKAEAGLGGSSVRLAYAHSLRRALLAPTRVVLDRHSRYYMRLAYAMDMRRQVHLPLPPATAAAARALSIVSICLAYASCD